MNIVLDLDGTLINSINETIIHRPFLEHFLLYVFRHFTTVSIWTSANVDWCNKVLYTFQPLLFNVSTILRRECRFHYILHDIHCTPYKLPNDKIILTKPLLTIQQRDPNFNSRNTLIIDDIPITYIYNQPNGINMPYFTNGNDIYLLILEEYLSYLIGSFHIFNNITQCNNGYIENTLGVEIRKPWYEDSGKVLLAQQEAKKYIHIDYMDLTED